MKFKCSIISIILFSFASTAGTISQAEKEKLFSLMRDSEPYVVGMGKSPVDVCGDMAKDMAGKYGDKLNLIGKTGADIMDSAFGICLNAMKSAEYAQSSQDISSWKSQTLNMINNEFISDKRAVTPKDFLVESVNKSVSIARAVYYMKELSMKHQLN